MRCDLETVPVDCLGSVTSASRHFQHLVRLLPCGRWTVPSIFLEFLSVSQANPFLPMPKPQANINFFTANSSSLRPTFLKIPLSCASLSFSVPQASSCPMQTDLCKTHSAHCILTPLSPKSAVRSASSLFSLAPAMPFTALLNSHKYCLSVRVSLFLEQLAFLLSRPPKC